MTERTDDERRFLGDLVCELIRGGMTAKAAAAEAGVPMRTLYDWRRHDPEFGNQYDEARQACADALAEETVTIADTETDAQRARNRIDARKWLAGTIKPREYGNRVDLNVNHTVDISGALAEARRRVLTLGAVEVIDQAALPLKDHGSE